MPSRQNVSMLFFFLQSTMTEDASKAKCQKLPEDIFEQRRKGKRAIRVSSFFVFFVLPLVFLTGAGGHMQTQIVPQ